MASTVKSLSARLTALEKTVARFLASEKSGISQRKKGKAVKKPVRKKVARRKVRVRPPAIEQLAPSGMPDFVTPMEKL